MGTLRGLWTVAEDLAGQQLGNWRVLARIGSGAYGTVYQAQNVSIAARNAAVKVLHPHLATHGEAKQRFLNEANAASRADHENIVQIFDGGITETGICYSVMELLRGISLADAIRQGPMDAVRALSICSQVASALDAAHALGIVHRDLKPENVFLTTKGKHVDFVKVLDFGVAKLHRMPTGPTTNRGIIVGTPGYMAPEQWMSVPDIDGRADIYALGVILYECLVGEVPFAGDTPFLWQEGNVEQPVATIDLGGLSAPIGELCKRMLAKGREHRPASMQRVADELDAIRARLLASGEPPPRLTPRPRPPGPLDPATTPTLDPTLARPLADTLAPAPPLGAIARPVGAAQTTESPAPVTTTRAAPGARPATARTLLFGGTLLLAAVGVFSVGRLWRRAPPSAVASAPTSPAASDERVSTPLAGTPAPTVAAAAGKVAAAIASPPTATAPAPAPSTMPVAAVRARELAATREALPAASSSRASPRRHQGVAASLETRVASLAPTPAPAPAAPPLAPGTYRTANEAYVNGDYRAAIALARAANRDGKDLQLWRLVGASSCYLGDRRGATEAWQKTGEPERKMIGYICQRNGLTLP